MRNQVNMVAATLAITSLSDPARAAAMVSRPVVDVSAGYLLGDSRRGGTLHAARAASAKATAGRQAYRAAVYRVYAWNRYLGQAKGNQPVSYGAPCEDTLFVKFSAADEAKFKAGMVGIAGNWNALPRVPRQDGTVRPVYKNAVAAVLRGAGIKHPLVRVTQVLRVDLEGDGVDEVLVTATNHRGTGEKANGIRPGGISPNARAGEYSLILLRKMVKGKVQTSLLTGEAFAKDKVFSAPNIVKVGGVFDLDGDGKMEIVVQGHYYEGSWTTVYSAMGGTIKTLATSGCGA